MKSIRAASHQRHHEAAALAVATDAFNNRGAVEVGDYAVGAPAILVLRDREGLDERSTSALLDISAGAAKSRLHRARNRFRTAWTP